MPDLLLGQLSQLPVLGCRLCLHLRDSSVSDQLVQRGFAGSEMASRCLPGRVALVRRLAKLERRQERRREREEDEDDRRNGPTRYARVR